MEEEEEKKKEKEEVSAISCNSGGHKKGRER